jgi:hypothetical protein
MNSTGTRTCWLCSGRQPEVAHVCHIPACSPKPYEGSSREFQVGGAGSDGSGVGSSGKSSSSGNGFWAEIKSSLLSLSQTPGFSWLHSLF